MASTHFTCINCSVRFQTAELQREHYKSDWHRYNLKRRVAELPPITAEDFENRLIQINAEEEKLNGQRCTSFYCNPCRRQFSSQKAHDNHLQSRKHQDNVIKFEQDSMNKDKELTTINTKAAKNPKIKDDKTINQNIEDCEENWKNDDELDEDEIVENPLDSQDCLFCKHRAEDLVANFQHMSEVHSFFLPDADYCVDPEGLLDYLGQKVAVYYICLWCNDSGKTFYSLDAVRKHMNDVGHCKMLHEGITLAEYADYYDYSSSYPDHEEGLDIDEELPDSTNTLEGDEFQLILPSGAVIGHRSLLRYYKQRLRPERQVVKKTDRKMHRLLNTYRSLGWTNTAQRAAACKARDIHVLKRAEAKWIMKLGCKANKLQKHFRQQVVF